MTEDEFDELMKELGIPKENIIKTIRTNGGNKMIKFRGVPLDDYSHDANVDFDGTFIYGNYEKVGDDVLISSGKFDLEGVYVPDLFAKVDPKTVGQFTGLKDINGIDIYGGDIIRSNYKYAQPKVSLVIREDGNSYIVGEDMATGNEMLVSDHVNEIEVIGNVYENQELLEG